MNIRRSDDEEGMDRRVPWQLRFAVLFGIPSLMAVYLVYWLTSTIDVKLNTIAANQIIILDAVREGSKEIGNYRRELETQTRVLEGIRATQYQICVNGMQGKDPSKCFAK